MKRKIAFILLIVILFNSIIPQFCYATEAESKESMVEVENAFQQGAYDSLNDDGSSEVRGTNKTYTQIKQTQTEKQMIITHLVTIFDMLPVAVHSLMTIITKEGYTHTIPEATHKAKLSTAITNNAYFKGIKVDESSKDVAVKIAVNTFTIDSLVRNQRQLFDVDFFNFSTNSDTNNTIKQAVASWYYTIRNLALIISLLVLIYVGIRMAISTTAIDRARYKKMLLGWFEGFLIIWLFPYILAVTLTLSNELLRLINIVEGDSFEYTITAQFYYAMFESTGFQLIIWSLAYWLLIWYQAKFLVTYAKRFLSIGFMIMVSPLISVTYAIDKLDDGRAQGFGILLKEIIVNIFIQPLHAVIYVIFIFTANEIAAAAPILAIVFLWSLCRAEKVVKNVFNMRGLTSIHSIDAIAPIKKKH